MAKQKINTYVDVDHCVPKCPFSNYRIPECTWWCGILDKKISTDELSNKPFPEMCPLNSGDIIINKNGRLEK